MYISGAVLAVPKDKKDAYLEMARAMNPIFMDYGASECVEGWEADISDGEHTDFRKAVKAEPGENIVFSWIVWPDRKTCDEGHDKMMQDARMAELPAMPFDGKRMIFGGFDAVYTSGR